MSENNTIKANSEGCVCVLGLGKAGVRIAETLYAMPESKQLKIGIADSDNSTIANSPIKHVFPISIEWTKGLGCGGDVQKGERAFVNSLKGPLNKFFDGVSLAIFTGGLGGGTATGGAPVLARHMKRNGIPSIFIVSIPFSFEGHSRRSTAEKELKSLVIDADVVLPIPNDILYSTIASDCSGEEAFMKANTEIARAIIGLSDIAKAKNLISGDFSDLRSAMNKKKSVCGIGIGATSDEDGEQKYLLACERLLKSPLLGGISQIKNANAVFISAIGGSKISLASIKQAIDTIQKYIPPQAKTIVGISTDKNYEGRFQLTMLTVQYEIQQEEGELPFAENLATAKDGVLPIDQFGFSRGIFSKTTPNMFMGNDLDIPTFQRKGIYIDDGKKR